MRAVRVSFPLREGEIMKILVPYDGSSYSTNSLEFVASRTTLLGKEPTIRLLLVQQPLPTRAAFVARRRQGLL